MYGNENRNLNGDNSTERNIPERNIPETTVNWTTPNMASWKPILLENAITPIQQYSYTTGKNSTDSAMIIDAMDILYSGNCDGFVLVSSDSDFTRLAIRLREAGMKVYGMGERKTPKPFIVACDKFVYIEVIRAAARKAAAQQAEDDAPRPAAQPQKPSKKESRKNAGIPDDVAELIAESVEDVCGEDGFAHMGKLSNLLMKKQPDFDPRNYGFSKLHKLIDYTKAFESKYEQFENGGKNLVIRNKG